MIREKFALEDDERSEIRWSQRKVGYVVLTEFANGPRGGRFRPVRSKAQRSFDRAAEIAEREPTRYRQFVRRVTIFEVDALGNVREEMVV